MTNNYWCNDTIFAEILTRSQHTLNEKAANILQIPKILHFVWLGSSLPDHFRLTIANCAALHPQWEIRVWNDEDIVQLSSFINRVLFNSAANFGMKSDIVRYEILNQFGGVYADVDYEFLQSLDDICNRCSFFVGQANTSVVEINNGVIGSAPAHPLLEKIIKQVEINCAQTTKPLLLSSTNTDITNFNLLLSNDSTISNPTSTTSTKQTTADQSNQAAMLTSLFSSFLTVDENISLSKACQDCSFKDTIEKTGPGMLTRVMYEYLLSSRNNVSTSAITADDDRDINGQIHKRNDSVITNRHKSVDYDRIVIFPVDVFSPVPNNVTVDLSDISYDNMTRISQFKSQYVTTNTIAIHWWQKSWYKK